MKRHLFCVGLLVILYLSSCVYHDTVPPIDCSKSGLSIVLDSIDSASSCAVSDGAIYVTGNGGAPPYRYVVDNKIYDVDDITSLSPGIYTVTIRDDNGCEAHVDNVNVPADGLIFVPTFQEDTECFSDNGSVTITILEGRRPYQFSIDGGIFTDDSVFTGLSQGTHLVKALDADACEIDLNVAVPRGSTAVRWETEIKPLFTIYCATKGCHNGISRTNDFRKYNSAKKFASDIKIRTQKRTMPFDGSLTQDQIDLIACWVDDGAPEN